MNTRIQKITDAATLLFLRQGYNGTQISHIAKEVGVSVGTIYLDFAGKKEIMQFVLKTTLSPDFMNREFERPITNDIFGNIEQEIEEVFITTAKEFGSHLEDKSQEYFLEHLVSDAFDLLARYAVGCLFIEKNQHDFPKLSKSYRAYRKDFFETMRAYLSNFKEKGLLRPVEHIDLATAMVIEILAWWAMDRRYIAFEHSAIPLELAKETCIDAIVSAYGI